MNVDATKAVQLESEFLSGMEKRLEQAKGKLLRGKTWAWVHRDESDLLRSLMARHGKHDRRLLAETPRNRRLELHSYERSWWLFGKKRVGVAVASVLAPLQWHVLEGTAEQQAPAVGAAQLLDHLRALGLSADVPQVIGVCSPTGFTPEALSVQPESSAATLVLIEPGDDGGWRVVSDTTELDPRIAELFDPETETGKISRVAGLLEERSAELLTGGLAVADVAAKLDLPEDVVQRAFEEVARKDPELHTGQQDGDMLLYRGVAAEKQESFSMSMVDRIRQLFSREGDEHKKINELSKRRAALSQRRDRLYDDVAKLEKREADLLDQGRQNKSQVVRRRIAAQLAQLRKDIQRQNTTTAMLNKQINILSTDIHNLTLIQQGQVAELPTTDELTENAVKAEEMLETLTADADLVGSLETGMSAALTSDEELAILQEFEESEQPTRTADADSPAPAQHTPAQPDAAAADPDATTEQRKEPEAS